MNTIIGAGLYLAWIALLAFAGIYWGATLGRRVTRRRRP